MQYKRCTRCMQVKPITDFPIRIDRGRKPRSHCRVCHNSASKTEPYKAKAKSWRYKVLYGVTVEQIDQTLVQQNNRCAICQEEFIEGKYHIDHDHVTNKFRQLLCRNCNKAIGLMKESAIRLRAAADYIEHHQAAI